MPATLRDVTPDFEPYELVVTVTDSAPTANTFSETIRLIVVAAPRQEAADRLDGAPADRPAGGELQGASFEPNSPELAALAPGFSLSHAAATGGLAETIVILSPPSVTPTVRVSGVERAVVNGRLWNGELPGVTRIPPDSVSFDVTNPDGLEYDLASALAISAIAGLNAF